MVLAPALDLALRRALRCRVAIAGGEFAGLRRYAGASILLGGFVVPGPSFSSGAARRCAVRLCQGAKVASIDTRTSPSNNRWRGP